jgi:hypothetical protein
MIATPDARAMQVDDRKFKHRRCPSRLSTRMAVCVMAWSTVLLVGYHRSTAAAPDYARDVRPLLERSCFGCHGPQKQKSDFRLDVREIALKGGESGKPAIVPHNAKASPLIRYVSGEDPDIVMPPKSSDAPRLNAAEIKTLRDWIDAGPSWPDMLAGPKSEQPHWSLLPLDKPAVPKPRGLTPTGSSAKAANPIDAFIQARLAEKKLALSPQADPVTLIRRVTYDLTGLPPTPEETDAFADERSPEAYEKLVERLLASPRFGERWARHWLDTIHFADSHGYEHDLARDNAWRFRDYVIASFNRDTPWPRFVREQLAADVFYPDHPELTPALGFLGAGTFDMSTYSTAPVTFDYLDRDDLVTQTMSALASTTANCARCHAHKFDPISQEDYYALQAVFAGITKGDLAFDEDPLVSTERRRWKTLLAAVERKEPSFFLASTNAPLIKKWLTQQEPGAHWAPLRIHTYTSTDGATLTNGQNEVFHSGGTRPDKDTYVLTGSTELTNITALRLEVLSDAALPKGGPGRQDNGNLHLSEIEMRVFQTGSNQAGVVKFRRASADFNQAGWGIERAIDGDPKTAWGIYPSVGQSHQAVFALQEPLQCSAGSQIVVLLKQLHGDGHLIGAFRIGLTSDDPARATVLPAEITDALAIAAEQRTETQRVAVAVYALRAMANEALARLPSPSYVFAAGSSVDVISGDPPKQAKVLNEPKQVHRLHRGEIDKPREVVPPGALSALHHLPARFALKDGNNEAERRAALAEWLVHPDNVLTWRSIVNRTWHYHFGRGLCDTPSDFGRMGGTPSHPELIDWLAVWFRDEAKGSLKSLHRLIVTSATYQQSSRHRNSAAEIDGENRLLWRQNRQRLDADAVRDCTLSLAGKLDLTMGGPGIRHFKASKGPQNTPALDYSAYDWTAPEGSRRSIYRFVWRGIPDPFMEALDFPDLGLLTPVRGFSASSLQALTLFNNDFILRQSALMARRVESERSELDNQVERAVRLAWLRKPTAEEHQELLEFARSKGLPALCRVLLNSNEFLFVN